MSEREKQNNLNLIEQHELWECKLISLQDMLDFKRGKINIKLPHEVEYPESCKQTKNSLIKRIFKRNK